MFASRYYIGVRIGNNVEINILIPQMLRNKYTGLLVGLLLGYTFSTCVMCLESDLHCSTEHLRAALRAGRKVVSKVPSLLQAWDRWTHLQIERLSMELDEFDALEARWSEGVAAHPMYVFRMINVLYSLRYIKDVNLGSLYDELPSREDLEGTVTALLRLQEFYLLGASDMAAGKIFTEDSVSLTPLEVVDIANYAYLSEKFRQAADWYSAALQSHALTFERRLDLLKWKAISEHRGGMIDDALATTKEMQLQVEIMAEQKEPEDENVDSGDDGWWATVNEQYKRLCREAIPRPKDVERRLFCHVTDRGQHPLLLLQPAQVEEQRTRRPGITIIHNVLAEHEISELKAMAHDQLFTSRVFGDDDTETTSSIRISKGTLLESAGNQLVHRIRERISAMTGFREESFETLQVANYGIGGYYIPHRDNIPGSHYANTEGDYSTDNRLATVLIYLSDVQAGGATAFPLIGERLVPKKGSAAVWLNLHRNGTINPDTLHAACPVLLGTKWISNQWILRNHNEFSAPCTTREQD